MGVARNESCDLFKRLLLKETLTESGLFSKFMHTRVTHGGAGGALADVTTAAAETNEL